MHSRCASNSDARLMPRGKSHAPQYVRTASAQDGAWLRDAATCERLSLRILFTKRCVALRSAATREAVRIARLSNKPPAPVTSAFSRIERMSMQKCASLHEQVVSAQRVRGNAPHFEMQADGPSTAANV